MIIGYRRYSGPTFLDDTKVKSRRGAYLEKRIALFKTLAERGHTVVIIKNGDSLELFDKILVEFGSTNYMFHKKDIDFSNEVLKSGKAIFILDDPDMMPKEVPKSNCKVWVNADADLCTKKWKTKCECFPISGIQPVLEPKKEHNGKYVYYGGTSGGREKKLQQYRVLIPAMVIYGEQKDYEHIIPNEPPEESERTNFYSNFKACLNITDLTHKKLQWRTGRKYDAIIAGCPALDENPEMFRTIETMTDESRLELVKKQQMDLLEDKEICIRLLEKEGM